MESLHEQKWQIVKRVDIGDVMATLIALVAVLAVFFRLEGQVAMNSGDIEDNQQAIELLREENRLQFNRIEYKLDRIVDKLDQKADK